MCCDLIRACPLPATRFTGRMSRRLHERGSFPQEIQYMKMQFVVVAIVGALAIQGCATNTKGQNQTIGAVSGAVLRASWASR